MNHILVIGAGRSSGALIKYLIGQAETHKWMVTIADSNLEMAKKHANNSPNAQAICLDVTEPNARANAIGEADVVISLLPAHMHDLVAQDCLRLKKHLATASYVSNEIQQLSEEVEKANLLFMGELGLDPGIDHMSAMQKIHEIKAKGGELISFKSACGGLVAPSCDDNPWRYKFSWSPRNVILAGQGTAQFKQNNQYKYIPYNRIFKVPEPIHIEPLGEFEMYANRDSLKYQSVYRLTNTPTILRATIRHKGYCKAWNALVKIGLTDDSYHLLNSENLSYQQLIEAFLLDEASNKPLRERLADFLNEPLDGDVMQKLESIDLFSSAKINIANASPAQILQSLLEKKWAMKPTDRDLVLMQHEFIYMLEGKKHRATSSLVIEGESASQTAMAKTVGLPLAIFVKHLMLGHISSLHGVHIPVMPEVYEPILAELKSYGIEFTEKDEFI